MMNKLSSVGTAVYTTVMIAAVVADIVLTIAIFRSSVGWALVYLIFGTSIFFTIAHWIGTMVASPFAVDESAADQREVPQIRWAGGTGVVAAAARVLACEADGSDEIGYDYDGYPWESDWLAEPFVETYSEEPFIETYEGASSSTSALGWWQAEDGPWNLPR